MIIMTQTKKKMAIYDAYLRFLNQIGFGEDIFITFINYKEDEDTKLASVLPLYKQDGFNVYREELSTVLKNNMALSRNSISTKRYITVYVNADTVEAAMQRLSILEELRCQIGEEKHACIKASDAAYAGVKLTFGDQCMFLKQKYDYCQFVKEGADIKSAPI